MEIIKVIPRGFCKGVVRAINIAKQTRDEYPEKNIYILGMLVHNKYVIEALEQYGIKTIENKAKSRLELLDDIPDGVVIFTAHGIHELVKEKALSKGLICVDASCLDVLRTQDMVKKHIQQGYKILYIGKKNHPEASAVCDYNSNIHLIEKETDIHELPHYDKVFVTNQTTMSASDVYELFNITKNKYPNSIISDEICNATSTRQQAIRQLENIDAFIVVGDSSSNNANRLAQIAAENNIKQVYLIDDVNDLSIESIKQLDRVAITAGASTPTYLINQVIHALETNDSTHQEIDIKKIL